MIKKLIALSTLAAIAAGAGPALAATTKTGTVTVQWNTQAIASLTLHTDYNASGTFNGGTQAGQILTGTNGGTGACTAVDPTNTDLTVNFGTPSPDGTNVTNCLYKSAVNAIISTNSTSWGLTEQATAGYTAANGTLCAFGNSVAFPLSGAQAGLTTAHVSARASAVAITTASDAACTTAGGTPISATMATLANAVTTAFTSASPANIGEDVELSLPAQAPTGTTTVTETYTLTAN